MRHPLDGILLVDKAMGETSHDVVKRLKRALRGLDLKKVGHAGTLDPNATGLLVTLLGQGTKLSSYIMSEKKRYLATITLGIETDTLDSEGKVLKTCAVGNLSRKAILRACRGFVGEIEQTPPAYSAVKVDGVRAYKLARKGVTVALKKRVVTIYSLKLLTVALPDITMEIECSGGTYMRSLAADLGRVTGHGGHLKALRRLAIGPFTAEDGIASNDIKALGESAKERVIPLGAALPGMREIRVPKRLASQIRCGHQPSWEELGMKSAGSGVTAGPVKVVEADQLVAITRVERDEEVGHGELKLERVFE